ncbi:hypothetical protein HHK36_024236 [Tetracentron sinense]|uniref:Uncharacterized protein n=1 Tax=Tetracentron sinense TaxID=13715 RepID=A0A835D6I0_TETSI|nr:hypothetical protein HHK36_024236 [Tetracentron sinense]
MSWSRDLPNQKIKILSSNAATPINGDPMKKIRVSGRIYVNLLGCSMSSNGESNSKSAIPFDFNGVRVSGGGEETPLLLLELSENGVFDRGDMEVGVEEEEQDDLSVHSPCQAPPSSASSLPKEQSQVELELRVLEALEIYPLIKLQVATNAKQRHSFEGLPLIGNSISAVIVDLIQLQHSGIHRHFVLYGLMEYLRRRFDRHFSPDEILQLLDRFYNLEMLKPDDEETEMLNQEEDFCLPQSYFVKEES